MLPIITISVESIQNITQMISANGYIASDARLMALRIIDYSVMKQTIVLALLDSLRVIGIACIAVLPLILLMKHNKESR